MKYFIIVPCLFVAVCSLSKEFQEKAMEKVMEISETCVPEVGATDDDIAELIAKKTPSRKEGKCLIACFSKKLGVMKDGKLSKEGAVSLLEPLKADDPDLYGKAMQVVDKCHEQMEKETETDECELALKGASCTHITAKEVGFDAESLMG